MAPKGQEGFTNMVPKRNGLSMSVFFIVGFLAFNNSQLGTSTCPSNLLVPVASNSFSLGTETSSIADNYNGTTVSVIVVASMQRSSSSYLTSNVMASMPCSLSLNELFIPTPQQSGDAWDIEGMEMFGSQQNVRDEVKTLDPTTLATFAIKVAQRRCHKQLKKNDLVDQCKGHCWVAYKHFEQHLAMWQHQMVWDSLLQQLRSQGQTFAMAVLERNVNDRWKSVWYAAKTGDWDTIGSLEHKTNLAAVKPPHVSNQYKTTHERYYGLIRGYYTMTNTHLKQTGQAPFPVVELDFDTVTSSKAKTQKLINTEIVKR